MSKDKTLQKEEKDFWDGCAGFGNGLWDSVESAATGIWDMVSSLVKTAAGIFNAVIHPVDTYNNIADSPEEYWEENWTNGDAETRPMVIGNIIGEVAIGLVGTKGADKLKSLKVIKVAGKAEIGAKPNELIGSPQKPITVKKGKESSEGGSGIGNNTTTINPKDIRFSQSSVNGSTEIIESMEKDGWKGDPIDVVQMPDGVYTTVDNTRVVSAKEAGINVLANVHGYNDPLPTEYIDRFTTRKGRPETWGDAVRLRVGKQKVSFKEGNPYGTYNMEDIK